MIRKRSLTLPCSSTGYSVVVRWEGDDHYKVTVEESESGVIGHVREFTRKTSIDPWHEAMEYSSQLVYQVNESGGVTDAVKEWDKNFTLVKDREVAD